MSNFLSDLMPRTDQVRIVGDFNVHGDAEHDSFRKDSITLIESVGFLQQINQPSHNSNPTLLIYDEGIYLVQNIVYSRCQSDEAVLVPGPPCV